MESLDERLAQEMRGWEAAGLRRRLGSGAESGLVDFVSNDYLSLSRHPALVAAGIAAMQAAGAGSRAARLLGGGSEQHVRAEEAMARWLGAEAALLFPTGYQANLGAICGLVGRGDVILSDARNHASMIDGARLSRARVRVHAHLDLGELESLLAESLGARRRLVLTESVFSMDGDAPELQAMAALCKRYDAWLLVDEAHSVGLLSSCEFADVRVVPCGKAMGVGGGFVVGSEKLREHLLNRARSFVFTTAPPPAMAGALEAAIVQALAADTERGHLRDLGRRLAEGLGLPQPAAAILPYRVGAPEAAVALSKACAEAGLDVRAVRPPTVPNGESGLRIVLHAHNTAEECERLIEVLGKCSAGSVATKKQADPTLFVVGTDTDIGKTVVSALLMRSAKRLGAAMYWKPVQTGSDLDTDSVAGMAGDVELGQPVWSLELPASPHAAALVEGVRIDSKRLDQALESLVAEHAATRLVIELAGGLLVPYSIDPVVEDQADWLAREGRPMVLVARSGLGTLNHTLLTLEALRARNLEPRALFLVGDPHASNFATLQQISGIAAVFEVETFPNLSDNPGASLDAWLDRHDLSPVWNP